MVVKCLESWDTEYSADTVEWCPDPSGGNVFALGTYQVDPIEGSDTFDGKKQRKGRLYLGQFAENRLQILGQWEVSAILDLEWSLDKDRVSLISADANGKLTFYRLTEGDERKTLEETCSVSVLEGQDDPPLALSLSSKNNRVLTSDSVGGVSLISDYEVQKRWKAHEFESWVTTFHCKNPDLFFSGGDDLLLKGFDSRMQDPTFVCRRHTAGVTSLFSHPLQEHILLSGRYLILPNASKYEMGVKNRFYY